MVFSSFQFLFFFLPVVIIGYLLIKPELLNAWLLVASLFFYYAGAQEYVYLLLLVIGIAYVAGIALDKADKTDKDSIPVIRKIILFVAVAFMVALMCYYKYFNFMVYNLNRLFHMTLSGRDAVLPIGISFFVFQAISYVVDVYKGEKYLKNPVDMALYISFFPQLIAGPIVRFHDIREYLCCKNRRITFDNFSVGVWRFSVGLCKKVIIANNLGGLTDIVFGASDIYRHSVLFTWLGAVAYTLQIYFDFSGYSDMAIGLGRIFGFDFQENFNYPYISGTIREFWRRWHISLSQFFRDYVYIPLGGNQKGKLKRAVNLSIVWLLTGIWHGAYYTYIGWGLGYGILILFETYVLEKININNVLWKILLRIYTLLCIIVLWVIFRAESVHQAYYYIRNMFGLGSHTLAGTDFVFQFKNYSLLILMAGILSTPIIPKIREYLHKNRIMAVAYKSVAAAVLVIGVVVSVSYIYMGSYNPFLYFMF